MNLYAPCLSVKFSRSVMTDSATLWTAACQASLPITNSQSFLRLMSIESVMPSNNLILCCPLLHLPSIFPSIMALSNESALPIKEPSIGVSASASVFPIQDWIPSGWTGWISFNTTVQKYQFFSTQLSLRSNSYIHTWLLEKPWLWLDCNNVSTS